MAARVTWFTRLWERVLSAQCAATEADSKLRLLIALFPSPAETYAGDTDEALARWRTRLLTDAERSLDSAVVFTMAAETLAFHGGSTDPTVPLTHIQFLSPREKAAVGRLRRARTLAIVAWEVVGWCRGHMSMASALLDSNMPISLILAQREYRGAYIAITRALLLARAAKSEIAAARQILRGPSSNACVRRV